MERGEPVVQGALFTRDFLDEGIVESPAWCALDDAAVGTFRQAVLDVYRSFPTDGKPSEAQTEDDLIWKVLALPGWEHVTLARTFLAEANTLEREVSNLVNEAYGLTPEEVDLM
ncbi:MAG: hypothetical protein IH626_12835 [Rhodospirillales bacterium]|nr:hypothetical protein [Rhodospirillales bacterium]